MNTDKCSRSLRRIGVTAVAAWVLLTGSVAAGGQAVDGGDQARPGGTQTPAPAPGPTSAPAQRPTSAPESLTRWIDVQASTIGMRYRYLESSARVVGSNQAQVQAWVRGRFKFDRPGRVSLNVMAGTGNTFTGSFDNTGWGTGDFAKYFAVKLLYAAAVPAKGVEISFGSFAPIRGESTEITTLDGDGYLAGERVSVKRSKDLYFDEVAFTSAYLGDVHLPNFFHRSERLTESRNYFQYLVSKRFTRHVAASADYSRQDGAPTVHAAVTIRAPLRVIDALKYEQYVRGGTHDAAGLGIYGEKAITKTLRAGLGYASIDEHYGGLNSGRFDRGNRIYESTTIRLTPELTMFVWAARSVATDYPISNRYSIEVGLSYNVVGGLQRHGWLK